MTELEDHGIPLVALKEQRRELVISLLGRTGPICRQAVQELSAIQSAISAVESVIADLDEEQAGYFGVYSSEMLIAS